MGDSTRREANTLNAPRMSQWQLESIQLVNWGGFDGYHRAEFELLDEANAALEANVPTDCA